MDDTRMNVFLDRFYPDNTPFLEQLELYARRNRIPVIRRAEQSALKAFLEMKKPVTVLEIGAAIGFSSIFICTYSDAKVTTIENYEKRIVLAKKHIREANMQDRITLLEGDAGAILKELDGQYDMIFMDAAKGQYITWLPDALRLLKEGGVLLSDNVLQEEDLLETHYQVERRNRTIHKRMREYLSALNESDELVTTCLPLGDGLALSVKKSKTSEGKDERREV